MTSPTAITIDHDLLSPGSGFDYRFNIADWLRKNPSSSLARDSRGRLTTAAAVREEFSLPPVTDPAWIWERYRQQAVAKTIKRKDLYVEQGAWEIETVWETPEIWIPKTSGSGGCDAHAYWDDYRSTYCSRPEGHGGRHAAHGSSDQSGRLIRVWAVWP